MAEKHLCRSRFKVALMDQAEYLDRLISNQQIQCVVAFEGRLDEGRMARALRLLMDAEPVLGCRFVERFGRPEWERRGDLDIAASCPVEQCPDDDERESRLKSFLTAPGDPGADPLVRLLILRGDSDTLCVKVDHVAADTGGVRDAVYSLLDLYRRLSQEPGFSPPVNEHGRRGLGQVLGSFRAVQRMRALKAGLPPGVVWGFPWRGSSHADRDVGVIRIDSARSREMRSRGREVGATVNDLVLTAYYRAMFEVTGTAAGVPCCIQVPIDLRRYVPGRRAEAVCNLSGQLYPTLERVPGEPFEDTLERVSAEMRARKGGTPGIGSSMVVAAITSPGLYATRMLYRRMVAGEIRSGKCNPYLSNLGELEPERLEVPGAVVTDACLVSPLMYSPGFLVGVSTFRDAMTVTVGYADAAVNGDVVSRFLGLLEGELVDAAG